jgi:hypothetical protein
MPNWDTIPQCLGSGRAHPYGAKRETVSRQTEFEGLGHAPARDVLRKRKLAATDTACQHTVFIEK